MFLHTWLTSPADIRMKIFAIVHAVPWLFWSTQARSWSSCCSTMKRPAMFCCSSFPASMMIWKVRGVAIVCSLATQSHNLVLRSCCNDLTCKLCVWRCAEYQSNCHNRCCIAKHNGLHFWAAEQSACWPRGLYFVVQHTGWMRCQRHEGKHMYAYLCAERCYLFLFFWVCLLPPVVNVCFAHVWTPSGLRIRHVQRTRICRLQRLWFEYFIVPVVCIDELQANVCKFGNVVKRESCR